MIENHPIVKQSGPLRIKKRSPTGRHPPFRHWLRFLIGAAFLLIIFLAIIAGYVQKGLWMRQLDYSGIFWTLLSVRWAMFGAAFVFSFLYLWINLKRAASSSAALQ